MSTNGDMCERHSRVLAELAETGMAMVRRLSEALLAADDPQTQAQLGLAYHRVSRAVRMAIALEMRLAQDIRREARAPTTQPPAPAEARARTPAERTGWNEYESGDGDEALDDLDALLDAEHLDEDAVHDAVEACIAHIRRDLDVDPALGLPGLAPPPPPLGTGRLPVLPDPGGRRSRLMGGAMALDQPLVAPARAPPLAWPSSA